MIRQTFIIMLLVQTLFKLHAQSYEELNNIFDHGAYSLIRNQVKYTQPAGFELVRSGKDYLECFHSEKYTSFNPASLTNFVDKLISKDKNFVVFIEIPSVYSRDSVYIDADLLPDLKLEINTSHCNDIRFDFRWNTGRDTPLTQCPISYKPSDYARSAFNADTVITYPLKMWKKHEAKYNHCQVMTIQKNTRGYISLYFFYTDKGKQNFENYMKQLNGLFWYREPKDYIKFVEPKQDSVLYIGHRKEVNGRIYYSAHNEITVELLNFRYKDLVSLLDQETFIKFYKADELYKLDELKKHELVATDPTNALVRIPQDKVYLLKYKVDVPDYQKVYLQMKYSRDFVSASADCDWKCYTDTFTILPYSNKRTRLDENTIVWKEKQRNREAEIASLEAEKVSFFRETLEENYGRKNALDLLVKGLDRYHFNYLLEVDKERLSQINNKLYSSCLYSYFLDGIDLNDSCMVYVPKGTSIAKYRQTAEFHDVLRKKGLNDHSHMVKFVTDSAQHVYDRVQVENVALPFKLNADGFTYKQRELDHASHPAMKNIKKLIDMTGTMPTTVLWKGILTNADNICSDFKTHSDIQMFLTLYFWRYLCSFANVDFYTGWDKIEQILNDR